MGLRLRRYIYNTTWFNELHVITSKSGGVFNKFHINRAYYTLNKYSPPKEAKKKKIQQELHNYIRPRMELVSG
jgi:hypothetical protein